MTTINVGAQVERHDPTICDECRYSVENTGPWEDGRRLCGPCKIRVTMAAAPNRHARRAALLALGGAALAWARAEEEEHGATGENQGPALARRDHAMNDLLNAARACLRAERSTR